MNIYKTLENALIYSDRKRNNGCTGRELGKGLREKLEKGITKGQEKTFNDDGYVHCLHSVKGSTVAYTLQNWSHCTL